MPLFRILIIRLLTTAITLAGVAVIVFFVIRVVPGNPIAMMLPPGATEADIARLSALYGLDKPIVTQFGIWLGGVLQGDFGTSITTRQPVLELVLGRLPATLELAIMALVMAVIMGGAAALIGTRGRGTRTEGAIDVANGMALSVPDFLWGLVLMLVFGVLFPIFHISGRVTPSLDLPFTTNFDLFESLLRLRFDLWADLVAHMFMPTLALAIPLAAIIGQLLKQSLKETMNLDYITLARTKGYGETQARGLANYTAVFDGLVMPAAAKGFADAEAADFRKVIGAALADPEGEALAKALASTALAAPPTLMAPATLAIIP